MTAPAGLFGEDVIRAGTVLPVQLNSSLNSRKVKAGQVISARLMQDIPLASGGRLRAGAKVVGRVISAQAGAIGSGARVSLQFDAVKRAGRQIPISTNLRALASMLDVFQAQLPTMGADRGTPENWWTTEQIGGDVVYRGDSVANGLEVVGRPTANGVLVHLRSKSGAPCRGEISGNDELQATWVFSADACGVYGFSDLAIAHAGQTEPVGQITLVSTQGDFDVRGGSGLLLRVNGSGR